MNILVTNIGRKIYFVGFLRDLQKQFNNLNIHLADNDLFSAAVNFGKTINHKIPLVSEGSKKYLNSIKKIISKNKINLIIPLTNYDLKILSSNKKKFKNDRKEWIENMHRTAPGVNWRQIDRQNRKINTNIVR